ncbi:MAG: thermonuclease family protein [Sphingomonas fennica]
MITPIIIAFALACTATDGDTIRCGDERIRLLGIDAPELPGHCRRGRVCAPGDGAASRRSLAGRMQPDLSIERVGRDRYGRTLAIVRAGRTNLSCYQLRAGQAIYKRAWDNSGRVRQACPEVAR